MYYGAHYCVLYYPQYYKIYSTNITIIILKTALQISIIMIYLEWKVY